MSAPGPSPTTYYLVCPPADEILGLNGNINVDLFTSLVDAQTSAVKTAILSGKYRVVMTSTFFASPVVQSASLTAQISALS